jgi:hypothetical protein
MKILDILTSVTAEGAAGCGPRDAHYPQEGGCADW